MNVRIECPLVHPRSCDPALSDQLTSHPDGAGVEGSGPNALAQSNFLFCSEPDLSSHVTRPVEIQHRVN